MPCFSPLQAYRGRDGVVFSKKQSLAGGLVELELPCGQCVGCRVERSQQWALRCVHEASLHERNSFLTLTYDDDHLPDDGGLDVSHWQKFAKRVRKQLGPFRFFHCGEYGDQTFRPHYHALVFGLDFSFDREVLRRSPHLLWHSPTLTELWGHGHVSIGAVTYETCAYVARYVVKKLTGNEAAETYGDLRPPYVTMSRGGRTRDPAENQGGIGYRWFQKYRGDVFPADEVVQNGRKFRPPRYYDEKLGEEELEKIKKKRRREVNLANSTPERLAAREKVLKARLALQARNLR